MRSLEIEIEGKKKELGRLKGTYGSCATCGTEGWYASWKDKLCNDCWSAKEIKEYRGKFEHIIGQTIADFQNNHEGDLSAIKLSNGKVIHVARFSDPLCLEIIDNFE